MSANKSRPPHNVLLVALAWFILTAVMIALLALALPPVHPVKWDGLRQQTTTVAAI